MIARIYAYAVSFTLLLDFISSLSGSGFPLRPTRNRLSTKVHQARRPQDYEYYDNYYDDIGEENEEKYRRESKTEDSRGGMYKVYFDGDIDAKETKLEWESCSDGDTEALVLLPPAAVERPTAIIHFVGGTFFGSAPKLWYRTFLEGLVRNTQCAVVITPIPVTLFRSPLQHINLSKKLQRAFDMAWSDILEDEYGKIDDVPLCGIGHSLGARLMIVLTTLTKNRPAQTPPFKSFALISFTNYGASAGIPGISTLLRQSKNQERTSTVNGERKRQRVARRAREEWRIDDGYDGYDDDLDEDWDGMIDELGGLIQESATRVKTALTPKSEDLEFSPTPDSLWKALQKDSRYDIPETLVVQFDDDEIDQSSKLAQTLNDTNSTNVKFCRLRGTHLSPISVPESNSGGWLELTSQASKSIGKIMKGRSKSKAEESAMRDLISSVTRYISDVVTK